MDDKAMQYATRYGRPPLRSVVSVTNNYRAGVNLLDLECGHTVKRRYNDQREQKRARCDRCAESEDWLTEGTSGTRDVAGILEAVVIASRRCLGTGIASIRAVGDTLFVRMEGGKRYMAIIHQSGEDDADPFA